MLLSSVLPSLLFTASTLVTHAIATPLHQRDSTHDHDHSLNSALPGVWYQDDDHEVNALFRRGSMKLGKRQLPAVGSDQWRAAYPAGVPDSTKMPQEWIDALNKATQAGKIPNIPPANSVNGVPQYPNGMNGAGPDVCSYTFGCHIQDDIYNGPDNTLAIGFDDGPLPPAANLYTFLQQNNQKATHFYIGSNILNNPQLFTTAFQTLQDDIAVHTYTHPYMTTLSNADVVAQLGWTMQIIHDSSGGRVPRFWRPPYGDTDNRVHAIAKEIFGLTTIIWNHDTSDWQLGAGQTPQGIAGLFSQWLPGPKSPGLVILEHELSDGAVQAFIAAYPQMKAAGWNTISTAQIAVQLLGGQSYQGETNSSIMVGADPQIVPPTSTSATSTILPTKTDANNGNSPTRGAQQGKNAAVSVRSNGRGVVVASLLGLVASVFMVML